MHLSFYNSLFDKTTVLQGQQIFSWHSGNQRQTLIILWAGQELPIVRQCTVHYKHWNVRRTWANNINVLHDLHYGYLHFLFICSLFCINFDYLKHERTFEAQSKGPCANNTITVVSPTLVWTEISLTSFVHNSCIYRMRFEYKIVRITKLNACVQSI